MAIDYQPLCPADFDAVIKLGNHVHGDGYLTTSSLDGLYKDSFKHNINASWVAKIGDKLVGFRLTQAAQNWQVDKWCTPELWASEVADICYFKCNTVDEHYRGHGIGSELLKRSIAAAKQQGAKAGLAHIWLASPGNSAFKYFSKAGGKLIKKHPGKWRALYQEFPCPICADGCDCVAGEILLSFD